jgi:hypothetical protein
MSSGLTSTAKEDQSITSDTSFHAQEIVTRDRVIMRRLLSCKNCHIQSGYKDA